jgi:hypothetical protein
VSIRGIKTLFHLCLCFIGPGHSLEGSRQAYRFLEILSSVPANCLMRIPDISNWRLNMLAVDLDQTLPAKWFLESLEMLYRALSS